MRPGTRLNGVYEIERLIAEGGMGEVYRGFNIQTRDIVAIKMIRPEFMNNPEAFELFRREASILHNLTHEAIVRYFVFSVDPDIRRAYLAMEFVNGPSLTNRLAAGPLPLAEVRILRLRIAHALEAAHRLGVVHRDVSPDNIILPDGDARKAKIIDFGIARSLSLSQRTIIGDGLAGKYNYMSPEQLGMGGGKVTFRSDIYSLGLVLAEAARGRPLDMSGSQAEIIEKRRAVPDLSDLDRSIRPLIRAMLEPLPEKRPSSMAAVAEWGEKPLAGAQRSSLEGDEARERESPGGRLAAILGALIAIVSVAGVGYVFRDDLAQWIEPHVALTPQPPVASKPPLAEAVKPMTGTTAPPPLAGPLKPVAETALPPLAPTPSEPSPPQPPAVAPLNTPQTAALPPAETPSGAATGAPATPPPAAAPSTEHVPTTDELLAAVKPAAMARPGQSAEPSAPAPPPEARLQPTPQAEPDQKAPPEAAAPPHEEARVEAPPGSADRERLFVQGYQGGDCFLVKPAPGERAYLGVGDRSEAFQRFEEAFKEELGAEPQLSVRLITVAQCPALELIRASAGEAPGAPRLELADYRVGPNRPLAGKIVNLAGRRAYLMLVDNDGFAYRLDAKAQSGGETATFSAPLTSDAGSTGPLQVVMAIVSANPIPALETFRSGPVKALAPPLVEAARAGAASVGAEFFKFAN